MDTKLNGLTLAVLVGLSVLIAPDVVWAYLGPGAGLGMIGSLIAVIVVVLVSVVGLVIYPLRILRKRRTRTK